MEEADVTHSTVENKKGTESIGALLAAFAALRFNFKP